MISTNNSDFFAINNKILIYKGKDAEVTVPAQMEDQKIISIGSGAYADKPEIKKIVVEEGIAGIHEHAFLDLDGLKELVLPMTLQHIESGAFVSCHHLKSFKYKIRMPKYKYQELLERSFGDTDGQRFIESFDIETPIGHDLENGFCFLYGKSGEYPYPGLSRLVEKIDRNIGTLFVESFDGVRSFDLNGGKSGKTDLEDIKDKISQIKSGTYADVIELRSGEDDVVKKEEYLDSTSWGMVPTWNEGEVKETFQGKEVIIFMEFMAAIPYCYKVKAFDLDGKTYYGAQKCILRQIPLSLKMQDLYGLYDNRETSYLKVIGDIKVFDENVELVEDKGVYESLSKKKW